MSGRDLKRLEAADRNSFRLIIAAANWFDKSFVAILPVRPQTRQAISYVSRETRKPLITRPNKN